MAAILVEREALALAEAEETATVVVVEEEEDDDEEEDGDFQDAGYWDEFYDDGEQFDWYSAPGAVYGAASREVARVEGALGRRARVLDVGCGTATHLVALAARADVTGVDFSPRVVELCREFDEGGAVSYVCADATALPFGDASFDVVLDKGCLDCFVSSETAAFDRRERYLREVARVLDPAVGVFVVTSVCGADVVSLLGDAVANRCAEATAGATRPPADAWERARTAPDAADATRFDVLQVVATRSKHVFRCVPQGRTLEAQKKTPGGLAADAPGGHDDDADFEDLTSESLSLDDGLFCGACAHRVSDLLPIPAGGRPVPANCPSCGAPLRRFAMS